MAGPRLHEKLHRTNHHTLSSDSLIDSSNDSIASPGLPFNGNFYLDGSIQIPKGLSGTGKFVFLSGLNITNTNSENILNITRNLTGNGICTVGSISSYSRVYDVSGSNDDWNYIYSYTLNRFVNWDSLYTLIDSKSAVYTESYNKISHIRPLSSNWNDSYTTLINYSADWKSCYTTLCSTSSHWVYTQNNSERWTEPNTVLEERQTGTTISKKESWDIIYDLKTDWQSTYTTTNTHSAYWESVYTTTYTNSAYWDSSYNTVYSNSAHWESAYETYFVVSPGVTTEPFTYTKHYDTYCGYFDGKSYLSMAKSIDFEFGTGNFTIECWISTTTKSSNILTYDVVTNCNWGNMWLYINGAGQLGLICNPDTGGESNRFYITGKTNITTGEWFHVAATRNGNNWYLFVNGKLEPLNGGTSTTYTKSLGFHASTCRGLSIGCNFIDSTPTAFYKGYISNIHLVKGQALYTNNFTPSISPLKITNGTVLLTLQNDVIIDNSTFSKNIISNGVLTTKESSPFQVNGNSGYFDNGGRHIRLVTGGGNITAGRPALIEKDSFVFNENDFTIESWICRLEDSSTSTALNNTIYSSGWDGHFSVPRYNPTINTTIGILLKITPSDQLQFFCSNNTNQTSGTTKILKHRWYHVAVSRQLTTIRLFVDGKIDAVWTPPQQNITWDGDLIIGRLINGGDPFNGYISNARITKGQALYTGNFTPSTVPLTINKVGATGAGIPNENIVTGNVKLLSLNANYQNNPFINNAVILPFSSNINWLGATQQVLTAYGASPFNGTDEIITGFDTSNDPTFTPNAPVGCVIAFAAPRSSYPLLSSQGWLYCDGNVYNVDDFPVLYSKIGKAYTYSVLPNTQFRVPDLRGQFIRGWSNYIASNGLNNNDAGRIFGSYQDDSFQGHWHLFTRYLDIAGPPNGTGVDAYGNAGDGNAGVLTSPYPSTVYDTGYGTPRQSTETRPANVALSYYIKWK